MQSDNLGRANDLYAEASHIALALEYLETGGSIIQVLIGPPISAAPPPADTSGLPGFPALIDTHDWTYPPQMVAAIVQQLTERRAAIDAELRTLGVITNPVLADG
jgi:hypothetical protein